MKMKNEVQTHRNEILRTCAHFYTELYSSTHRDHHPSQKNRSPDTSEVPLIMTEEVEKTLKEMKNNKALHIDKLTSDVMMLEGGESAKQISTNFNQILKTKKIPVE